MQRRRLSQKSSISLQSWMEMIRQRAEDCVLKTQQLLGRSASGKTMYTPANHGETFNKKHVRVISVVVFLMCVCMFAVYAGIYYTFYFKPCTKKFLFRLDDNNTCAIQTYNWREYFWPTEERSSTCNGYRSVG